MMLSVLSLIALIGAAYANGDWKVCLPDVMDPDPEEVALLKTSRSPMSLHASGTDILQRTDKNRNAMADTTIRWEKNTVPYDFSGLPVKGQTAVTKAIAILAKYTCLRWVKRTTEKDYVKFKPTGQDGTCSSYMGNIKYGAQELNLGDWCFTIGHALHEMMHALGFAHEHNRPDRDSYVTVAPGAMADRINYGKYDGTDASLPKIITQGLAYDTCSILHYGESSWITVKDPKKFIGQRMGLTKLDIQKINKYYACPAAGK